MYKFIYWLVYIVLYPFYRFRFTGLKNLPEGACLVCGNHTALVDSVLVVLALGPQGNHAVIAKAELFKIPVLSSFLRVVHAFPVRRGESDAAAIKIGLRALKEGKKFIIFPEGTRVKNGKKVEPKPGAGMFSLRSGAPIVPVFVPIGRKVFKRNTLIFGTPYYPVVEGKPSIDDYLEVTYETMRRVRALGEENSGAARLEA